MPKIKCFLRILGRVELPLQLNLSHETLTLLWKPHKLNVFRGVSSCLKQASGHIEIHVNRFLAITNRGTDSKLKMKNQYPK